MVITFKIIVSVVLNDFSSLEIIKSLLLEEDDFLKKNRYFIRCIGTKVDNN